MTHEQHPSAPNQQIAMPLEAMPRRELIPDVPFALDVANPKIPREQAQTYGIDRDITAVIALPMEREGQSSRWL